MFTIEERVDMARRVVAHLPNVTVETYDGLLASTQSSSTRPSS